ncbi:chaperone protein PapD [Escherichia coli]|nr:chaperone protein PapD [Escherichia coli]
MTLDISNDNKQLPYLAQAWIENENQEKIITGPVIATPPVQRLEPGAKSMVRLSTTPDISKLPQEGNHCFILISGKYRRGVKRPMYCDSLTDQNKAFLSPGSN